jgi:aminotransferase EvaB
MNHDPIRSPVPMNDLSRAIARDRDVLTRAVSAVLDSAHVVLGPQHGTFQLALADYLGVASAVGVGSGTDALELALKVAMPEGKTTVLAAANAGGYTSTAARRSGYGLRYADVDPNSLCLSATTVAEALTDDVGVVVVTHLYGNLTDMNGLVQLCRTEGIRLVEDCAQAIGARRPEGAAGSFGDLATISFYPTKNLGALGDGGAVVTNSPELAAQVTQLRQYGWESKYRVAVEGGINSRLDELQAAFLLARLPMLDALNERRRNIVTQYAAAALGGPLQVLPASGPHHVAHLAAALTADRDATREHLASHGVATDIHFPVPDHHQPGFRAEPHELPVTERTSRQVFSLPCFPEMTDEEVNSVCRAIRSLS